ncbi:MAG: hypothetical protein O3A84_01200 [Proteobacteria bacterium]|nr:hypothetical protein [Pseudomonadota bacterium]
MNTPTQRDCCVLGRAMNMHNQPGRDPDAIEEKPIVQISLFALSALSFLIFFV